MTDIARERRFLKEQGLDIIYREQWGAQSYSSTRLVSEPVEGFFLHISVTIDGGNTGGSEADDMRDIEAIGNQRFNGIGFPYNAAAFDTGRLYEGQPLTRRGAHTVNDKGVPGFRETGTSSLNYWYRAIVLPQMVTDDVTTVQVDQCARWAAAQIRAGYAKPNATWHGHRDVAWKSCPGDTGYAQLPRIRLLTAQYVANGLGPPPTPNLPKGDGMFAYELTHGGNDFLVLVAGGKQVRVNGATIGAKIRGQDYFIGGPVDDFFESWLRQAYGPVIGLP